MNIDDFFGQRPGPLSELELRLALRVTLLGKRVDPDRRLALRAIPTPLTPGLRQLTDGEGEPVVPGVVLVGTIRMGYGHYRIASSAASWVLAGERPACLYDLLRVGIPEADVIRRMDRYYGFFSRLASNAGGPVEWLWDRTTVQGNLDSLRLSSRLAERLQALMGDLPRDIPFISTHPFNGLIAVAAGFTKVVNLIVDNHPQYFLLVPGALNLVQGPASYARYLQLGVPAESLAVGGHWVPYPIASAVERDCAARAARARAGVPRRLLLPIGGAGAQRAYVASFIASVADRLRCRRLSLLLNTGDHQALHRTLIGLLDRLQIGYQVIGSWEALRAFCAAHPLAEEGPEPPAPVTLCTFTGYFEAFSATDQLIRAADVLATKPSELAFYPIPKLHLRRVGRHEGFSALRSAELGDGTLECRTVPEAVELLALMCDRPELLLRMNEDILRQARIGTYQGCKVAAEAAAGL